MEQTVTYVEMTSPADLRPAPAVPGVELEPLPATSPLIREVTVRIGSPYHWPSTSWTDSQWAEFTADPRRAFWLVRHADEIAGFADVEIQDGGDVEITTFGLLPESIGKGLGGYALTLVVDRAWTVPGARRVWLHTSDLDHPRALPNYLKRGFRPFKTVKRPPRPTDAEASSS